MKNCQGIQDLEEMVGVLKSSHPGFYQQAGSARWVVEDKVSASSACAWRLKGFLQGIFILGFCRFIVFEMDILFVCSVTAFFS